MAVGITKLCLRQFLKVPPRENIDLCKNNIIMIGSRGVF